MALLDLYNYVIYDLGDPRNRGSILTDTPWAILGISFIYWFFVRVFGPNFMKNREPYRIEGIIKIYNYIQILWNLYLFLYTRHYVQHIMQGNIHWWCIPLEFSSTSWSVEARYAAHHYFYNKIFDLMDTVFFVLRKKFKQATYTHVYHHLSMIAISWVAVKYSPGGNLVMVGILNTLVHTVMYTYYTLSLIRGSRSIWWKKYLTQMQMVQFATAMVYISFAVFRNECNNNTFLNSLAILQGVYFTYLFTKFYIKNYILVKPEDSHKNNVETIKVKTKRYTREKAA